MRRPGRIPESRVTARARKGRHLLFIAGGLLACLALSPPAFGHEAIERQIADLDARLAAHPRDASLYLARGELHRLHADWDAAARDYRRAREIDPGLDAVDLCVGRLHLDAGRPTRAIESLDRFLRKRPDLPEARVLRARALVRLGKNLEAAPEFTRAIAAYRTRGTPDPDLFLERARALAESPRPRIEDALGGLDEGLDLLGPVVGLGLYAIDLESRLGRFDAALARLDRLAAASPRKESYLVRRGEILEAASRRDEARRAYEDALAAIALLSAERRGVRAVQNLKLTALAGLERLAGPAGTPAQGTRGGAR